MKKLIIGSLIAATAVLSGCGPESVGNDVASTAPTVPDQGTAGQESATAAAERYLDTLPGFSHDGLVQQLVTGSGFSKEDATYAVDNIQVDWNQQAAVAAKRYQDTIGGFSHDGLVQQLVTGSQFTPEQAEFGVSQTGL